MGYLARHAKPFGVLTDLVSFIAAFYLSYYVLYDWMGITRFSPYSTLYFETEVLCLISWSIALSLFVEYPSRRTTRFFREVQIVVTSNCVALLILTMGTFLFKVTDISRLFVGVYLVSVVLLMFLNRYVVRLILYLLGKSGWDSNTRIIIGNTESAMQYLSEVAGNKRLGVHVLGYVADANRLPGVKQLGTCKDIDEVLKRHSPDGVVIALRVTDPFVEQIIQACEKQGVSVELLLDNFSFRIASSTVHHGSVVSSLCLSAIPHTPGSLFVKRLTDVAISLTAALVLSPIFLAVAIAIKVEDGGPILFKQERVGLRNKLFTIYKFRSMRVDAEEMKKTLIHLNEMSGPVFKLTNDPRTTKVGKFIRSLSLDELPQLFNVLIGDMSLVGPRPPLPTEVSSYIDEHRRRLSVKPGLTCLWQVSGRSDVDFEQWMDLDLAYIDNWTYLQDWKIMFRTIPAVLRRTGAR